MKVDKKGALYPQSLDHHHLRNNEGKRVRDGMLLRLINKWLNAGVMEDEAIGYPEALSLATVNGL